MRIAVIGIKAAELTDGVSDIRIFRYAGSADAEVGGRFIHNLSLIYPASFPN